MRKSFWVLGILLMLTSCSSKPEDLIVGTWKFDAVELSDKNRNSDPFTQQMIQAMWSQVEMKFNTDGTCEMTTGSTSGPQKSSYRLENNGRTIVTFEANGAENRMEIVKLTRSELVLLHESGEIGFVKK